MRRALRVPTARWPSSAPAARWRGRRCWRSRPSRRAGPPRRPSAWCWRSSPRCSPTRLCAGRPTDPPATRSNGMRAESAHTPTEPQHVNPPLTVLPAFHLRLRRLRRSPGLKQAYVAVLLGVDQSTVSRWESGALVPEADQSERALQLLGGAPRDDCALRRLVRTSTVPCHLVTDADHRLLAVSLPRQREWV